MGSVAIITARGGSKRTPRKNIKPFCGKPIILYSIEAALQSNVFDEVMVSTDDQEIADIAQGAGAKVPFFRSAANSDDHAITADVLMEVLEEYTRLGQHFDTACCIYPTAPFITAQKLIASKQLLEEGDYDTLFPVVEFSYPIQRALKKSKDNLVEMFQPEHKNSRSQDLVNAYHDAGQFYWFKTEKLLEHGSLWTENSGCIVVSQLEVQDIDTEVDWKLAELKYQLQYEKA